MFSLRLVILSYCTSPWHVLVNQILRGLCVSLPWAAMVEYVWTIFPKHVTTTAVGLLVSIYFTGTGIISSVVGGYLYHRVGGDMLFRGMALLCFIWCLVLLLYFEMKQRKIGTVEKCCPVEIGEIGDTGKPPQSGHTL